MSGFTTTGATLLSDIEAQSPSILFWRSMTHWLGGIGIVVLFGLVGYLFLTPYLAHALGIEMPGHGHEAAATAAVSQAGQRRTDRPWRGPRSRNSSVLPP